MSFPMRKNEIDKTKQISFNSMRKKIRIDKVKELSDIEGENFTDEDSSLSNSSFESNEL